MKAHRVTKYLLAGFLIGACLLIAIERITNNNVRALISGNEQLIEEFHINHTLINLQRDLSSLDLFSNQHHSGIPPRALDQRQEKIREDIRQLEGAQADSVTSRLIRNLEELVGQKLALANQLSASDSVPLQLLTRDKLLSDSIASLTQRIDTSGQARLARGILLLDKSGDQLVNWNYYIVAAVLLLFATVFAVVLLRMKWQAGLITQLNESEDNLKKAVTVKENFLANMSHEIRTPLNAIIGYTGLLERKPLESEAQLYVSTIRQSGEHLLSIVNEILDLSKIEAGMMRIEEAPFRISEVLRSVEALFAHKMQEKGLKWIISITPNLIDNRIGDANRLTQVLVNLVGNAIKFTEHGQVAIHVYDENHVVCFEVSDTGIGIAEDKLATIFDRFSQAEESTTRHFGGTGLGLAIVRELVELQDGSIGIKSQQNLGTTVSFSIPYGIQTPSQTKTHLGTAVSDAHFAGMVLIVEDNPVNLGLIVHLFRDWHIRHLEATNGLEAVKLAGSHAFDMILMDIQMPEMDGYEAAMTMREQLQLTTPIVAMTAHAMEGQRQKCLDAGMDDYLAKPVREKELRQILNRYLPRFEHASVSVPNAPEASFEVIDLTYLREISGGDIAYEKTATAQFLDIFPEQLSLLRKAVNEGDAQRVQSIAHNLKTTISIMGLDTKWTTMLEELEAGTPADRQQALLSELNLAALPAIKEANLLLHKLTGYAEGV